MSIQTDGNGEQLRKKKQRVMESK